MEPYSLSTAGSFFVGQAVSFVSLYWNKGNVTSDENTSETALRRSAEPQIWRRLRARTRRYIEESHISLGYLTTWRSSSRTKMTRATLSKQAVCRQVPEMRNIRNDARRKYVSDAGNSKTALGGLTRNISPSSSSCPPQAARMPYMP
jgi:hypothetical protein